VPAQLVTEQGPTSAALCILPENEDVGLGRNPGNGLVLLDRHVSRWHATISGRNGRYFIRDKRSVNGTKLDSRMLECETPLRDGQVIRAGAVVLRFSQLPDENGRPMPPLEMDPAWLMANDGAVKHLAAAILEEANFALLPVLADALEDAGCRDVDLLEHCRRGEGHRSSCWVLDLILPPPRPVPQLGDDSTVHKLLPWSKGD
jgi:hypothetical protein